MVCSGFKLAAEWWKAQMNPLSYTNALAYFMGYIFQENGVTTGSLLKHKILVYVANSTS